MSKKIIYLKQKGTEDHEDSSCSLKRSCPVGVNIPADNPVAAIYSMITNSGDVLRGAQGVKPAHVRALLDAIDCLIIDLQEFYNTSIQTEIEDRTGHPFHSKITTE